MTHSTTHLTGPLNGREFAFVDPSVQDLDVLLKGLQPQITVSVLSAEEPAPRQMARVLARHQEIDVLHVIAHGQPGEVSFAGGALSLESLEEHRDDLARIGSALAADGEIRLWVCDAAGGDKGAAFIGALARNTGVPVAASAGRVGAAAHGGSWTLDARAGGPVLPPLTPEGIAAYAGVLATFNATTGIDDLDGGNQARHLRCHRHEPDPGGRQVRRRRWHRYGPGRHRVRSGRGSHRRRSGRGEWLPQYGGNCLREHERYVDRYGRCRPVRHRQGQE